MKPYQQSHNMSLNKTLNKTVKKSLSKKRFNNLNTTSKVSSATLPNLSSTEYCRAYFKTDEDDGIYPCVYSPRRYNTPGMTPTGEYGPLAKTHIVKAILSEMDYAWRVLKDGSIEYYPNYEDDCEKSKTSLFQFEGEIYHSFAGEWFSVYDKITVGDE